MQPGAGPGQIRLREPCRDGCTHNLLGLRLPRLCWAAHRGCSRLHDKDVATAVSTHTKEPRDVIRD